MAKKKTRVIQTHKEAAEVARDLHLLRESIRVTKIAEAACAASLHAFMVEHNEKSIEQEGFATLRRIEQSGGLEWDFANMPDEDLHTLRDMGVLTVLKGMYDAYVEEHGPVGLLNKWAYATGTRYQLRFEQPSLRHPREKIQKRRRQDANEAEADG